MPTKQNGQTHSNNSSATVDELFECVWPFCGLALRVKQLPSTHFVQIDNPLYFNVFRFFAVITRDVFRSQSERVNLFWLHSLAAITDSYMILLVLLTFLNIITSRLSLTRDLLYIYLTCFHRYLLCLSFFFLAKNIQHKHKYAQNHTF